MARGTFRIAMPLTSAIVVNFRSAPLARDTCRALADEARRAAIELETLVVDNSGTDEDRAILDRLDGVRVLRSGSNRGYAGGLNDGAAAARGDRFLFLNPDLDLRPGFLAPLLAEADRPGVGAAGPRFVWDAAGTFRLPPLEIPSLVAEIAKIAARRRGREGELLRRYWQRIARPAWEATQPIDVPGLVGAALAVSRGAFDRIGPFDERFPLYFEDTDFGLRLRRAGFVARLVPGSIVRHLAGESARRDPAEAGRRFAVSEAEFFAKHWNGAARALRRAAGRLLPPRAAHLPPAVETSVADAPPEFRWAGTGPFLVEISPLAEMIPTAAAHVAEPRFLFPSAAFAELPAGRWHVRVTDLATKWVILRRAFEKA